MLLDLILDPVAAERKFWVWYDGGGFFGIPLRILSAGVSLEQDFHFCSRSSPLISRHCAGMGVFIRPWCSSLVF
ncbi:carotenoid biosynthesis protein [Bacillus sp. B6(2022)]|nr:carotenoid biosynthesis protein [Bacillus sp. B6(2022)]